MKNIIFTLLLCVTFNSSIICADPLKENKPQEATQVKPPEANSPEQNCIYVSASPKKTFDVRNLYPVAALEKGLEGRIKVKMKVDASGNVTDANIVSSSDPLFNDPKIISKFLEMKFSPAMKDCKPIATEYFVQIGFGSW